MVVPIRVGTIGAEIAALLLSASCAGCGESGTLLCEVCREQLTPEPALRHTPQGLAVWSALSFEGVAARCIRRLKGEGETLLARPLATALAPILARTLSEGAAAVPMPTGRAAFRRRGYRVPDLLIRRAGALPLRVLRDVGGRVDQRGLDARERADNVRGALRARLQGDGLRVVIVDDVITTGSTMDEGARVLLAAGFDVLCGVALAATPMHRKVRDDPGATRSK